MLLVARFWFEKFFLSTGMRVDGARHKVFSKNIGQNHGVQRTGNRCGKVNHFDTFQQIHKSNFLPLID